MSKEQYYVLNEKDIKDIFWPAESELRRLTSLCGSAIKIFVINDCCREDYQMLRDSMETDQERSSRLEKEESAR